MLEAENRCQVRQFCPDLENCVCIVQLYSILYLHSSFFSKAHDVEKGGQKPLHSAKISTSKELGTNTCTVMGPHQNKYKQNNNK